MEQVEHDLSLQHKLIPQVECKILVDTAEASNDMGFEHSDRSFCCIVTMDTWGHKLIVNTGFVTQELFQNLVTFIVELPVLQM